MNVIIKDMQGKKELKPKLMYQVTLADLVPENNIYRMILQDMLI